MFSTYNLLAAGWNAANLANLASLFTADAGGRTAQEWAQIAVAHASLRNRENNVATLATAGWTSTDLVDFVTQAIAQGLAAANLQAFIATAGAAAAAVALISPWGSANEVGRTVGWALTQAGNPTNAQLVQLLHFSQVHGWTGAAVRNATAAALCGAPNWANVINHAPTFTANHIGPLLPAGMGGTPLASQIFPGALGGTYRVRLRVKQERVNHASNGHTYEHFHFTYANCVRNGVGGRITFYPYGTNVEGLMTPLPTDATAQALADLVVWYGFNQQNIAGNRVGINREFPTPYGPPSHLIWPTAVAQFYPLAGTQIVGRDLVAIGRLMGLIS